jgi:hypothetical protein
MTNVHLISFGCLHCRAYTWCILVTHLRISLIRKTRIFPRLKNIQIIITSIKLFQKKFINRILK